MRTEQIRNHVIALASIFILAIFGVDLAQAIAIPYGLGLMASFGISTIQ